ncbi:MAG: hypothetical protein IJH91_05545 [Mogibacterium sp.]|nr:hypothetical protein [Mogibacterium sp.]
MAARTLSKKKKKLLLIIGAELVVVLAIILLLYVRSLHLGNETLLHNRQDADQISAENGLLSVNDVSVEVPAEGAKYTITYEWAEDDEEYPTIPTAASVAYSDDDGNVVYEAALYKVSFTPTEEIPEGKDVSNWFDDWDVIEDENVTQRKYNTNTTHGFLITVRSGEDENMTVDSYSYYFVQSTSTGMGLYVLEFTCFDAEYAQQFGTMFAECMQHVSLETSKEA